MDDISTKINQILNDPERMKEISAFASTLGFSPGNLSTDLIPENSDGETNAPEFLQKTDDKQQALVRALLPYLRPNHQKKLEQAVKLIQLSHWARSAMQTTAQMSEKKEDADDL